jgi:hypothetical protein
MLHRLIPNSGFYRFAQFGKTKLYFKDGNHSTGERFNYNMLSARFQFIGQKGDTLDLVGGQEKIDSLIIDGITFLYNDGWAEVAEMSNTVALLKKTVLKINIENLGAFGLPNSTVSVLSIDKYFGSTDVHNLVLKQDVVIIESVSMFWMNKNNRIAKATKSNLLKMLPGNSQTKAETYLSQNKVNFNKEVDLKKLIEAISTD